MYFNYRRFLFFLTFSILFNVPVLAQLVVGDIQFANLKRTKPSYLNVFLETKVADPLDSSILAEDLRRLINLEFIQHAEYAVKIKDNHTAEVTFIVQEFFTLLPILSFGSIEENHWFQIGLSEVNLWGKGHKFTGFYQFYDRHSYVLDYLLPRINGSDWGFNLNFTKWSTIEPLYFDEGAVDYNYDNFSYGVNAIYHFNYTDNLLFGGSYFTETYDKRGSVEIAGAPALAKLRKSLFKIILTMDRMNHHFYFQNGWFFRLNTEAVYDLDQDHDFYIAFSDIIWKNWVYGKNGIIANHAHRLRVGLSSNDNTPFAPFVLDSYVNIRGVGNRVDRGTGVVVWNSEYRHTLLDLNKVGIQGVLFSDLGTWRQPGGDLDDFIQEENFEWYAGGGFRLIYKPVHNAIFRVDYGVDLIRGNFDGFVVGIGQYF